MIRLLAGCVAALASCSSCASALDEAMRVVLTSNPVLVSEQAQFEEQARQRDWSTELSLSWTEQGTEYGGKGGPNAGIRVRIPLFDRSHDLKVAQARTALQQQRDTVLRQFLADVQELNAKAADMRELDTMRRFYRDRLEYRKKQVADGLAEPDTLWIDAEKMQQADNEYRRARTEAAAMRERMARQYGGKRWKTLLGLLVECAKPSAQ